MEIQSGMANLPPILLTEAMTWLMADQIGKLYMCGCKLLNWKLTEGGGVQVWAWKNRLDDWKDFPSLMRLFPKLKDVVLYDTSHPVETKPSEAYMEWIPRNVKRLKFWFRGDAEHLEKMLRASGEGMFPELTSLSVSMAGPRRPLSEALWTLMPKTLTELDLTTPYGEERVHLRLSGLPPHLTTLKGRFLSFAYPKEGEKFPETIIKLQLDFTRSDGYSSINATLTSHDWFPLLPAGLTNLHISNAPQSRGGDWSLLPRGLATLTLGAPHFDEEAAKALPPNLKSMSILEGPPKLSVRALGTLPQTLTTLIGVIPEFITAEVAAQLPRSLTQLTQGETLFEAIPELPLSMNRLKLRNRRYLNGTKYVAPQGGSETLSFAEWLLALRKLRLTYLDLMVLDEEVAQYLPDTLKEMAIDSGPMSDKALKYLPRDLKSIILTREQPFESESTWKDLPNGIKTLDLLPVNREAVILHCKIEDSAGWLPSSLTKLTLGPMSFPCVSWLSHLPKTLTYLKLQISNFDPSSFLHLDLPVLDNMNITILEDPVDRIAIAIRNLPPSLQYFTLYYPFARKVETHLENDDLKSLPKNLKSLTIPLSSAINSDVKPFFPASLQSLDIGSSGTPSWLMRS
jgi:hypothetical protein